MDLDQIKVQRKSGAEQFHADGAALGHDVREFWAWSASDLVNNTARGCLAEYIIATALGIDVRAQVRNDWEAFDLIAPRGTHGTRIQVKSAAYLQSWAQSKPSTISFLTRPTRAWDSATGKESPTATRHADVYVFALLAHRTSKKTLDPLNVNQWRFFVLPTFELDERSRSQHSITLKSLEALCGKFVRYGGLRQAIEQAASSQAIHNGAAQTPECRK